MCVWDAGVRRGAADDFLGEVRIDLPAELGGGKAPQSQHLHRVWALVDLRDQIPAAKLEQRGARAHPLGVVELELSFVPVKVESEKVMTAIEDRMSRDLGRGPVRPAPSHQATRMKLREHKEPYKHRHHRELHIADGCVTINEKRRCVGLRNHKAESYQVTGFTDDWQQNHLVKTKQPTLAFTIHTLDDTHVEKHLVVVAKTAKEKATWLKGLEATVDHKRQIAAIEQLREVATPGDAHDGSVRNTRNPLLVVIPGVSDDRLLVFCVAVVGGKSREAEAWRGGGGAEDPQPDGGMGE